MHLNNALGLADNSEKEFLHNIIMNVFQVVLVDALMISPHALPQLEPNLLLEVDAFIKSQLGTPFISNTVTICPGPEVFSG